MKKQINIRMPVKLWQALKKESKARGVTLSAYVIGMLKGGGK